jgi:hypothetical protein
MQLVFLPALGIGADVIADVRQFPLVADDAIPVIAQPGKLECGFGLPNPPCRDGFPRPHNFAQLWVFFVPTWPRKGPSTGVIRCRGVIK